MRLLIVLIVLLFRTFFFSMAFRVMEIPISHPRMVIGALICAFASSLFTSDLLGHKDV